MFTDPALGESDTWAVFVDPATADVTGDLTVYGTNGSLGVHTWVGQLHHNLHLGEVGRLYSEVPASWLGIIAPAGLVLWVQRIRKTRKARGSLYPDRKATGRRKLSSLHSAAGVWLVLGFFILSATGLTWSTYAGANVTNLRSAIGWPTPTITTDLSTTGTGNTETGSADGEHAGHGDSATPTAQASRLLPVLTAPSPQPEALISPQASSRSSHRRWRGWHGPLPKSTDHGPHRSTR